MADELRDQLRNELDTAEAKAWDSLARYKFTMFGYWAAIWVHLNRIGGFNRPNPWRELVLKARIYAAADATSAADAYSLFERDLTD